MQLRQQNVEISDFEIPCLRPFFQVLVERSFPPIRIHRLPVPMVQKAHETYNKAAITNAWTYNGELSVNFTLCKKHARFWSKLGFFTKPFALLSPELQPPSPCGPSQSEVAGASTRLPSAATSGRCGTTSVSIRGACTKKMIGAAASNCFCFRAGRCRCQRSQKGRHFEYFSMMVYSWTWTFRLLLLIICPCNQREINTWSLGDDKESDGCLSGHLATKHEKISQHKWTPQGKSDVTRAFFWTFYTFGPLRSWTRFQTMLSPNWRHCFHRQHRPFMAIFGMFEKQVTNRSNRRQCHSVPFLRKIYIETIWNLFGVCVWVCVCYCLWVFFLLLTVLKMLGPKHSSFVCQLNGWSSAAHNFGRRPAASASSPSSTEPAADSPGSRLRPNAAPPGGGQRQGGLGGAFALEKGCGGCAERLWPGASKAGPETGALSLTHVIITSRTHVWHFVAGAVYHSIEHDFLWQEHTMVVLECGSTDVLSSAE